MSAAPIAVFDSGVGGLSILQALRAQLPYENFLYFADTLNAPYGEKEEAWIHDRTVQVAEDLLARGAKAVVVACNTATAAAIATLRQRHPLVPFVGIEPAIKPAAHHTSTGHVGVLATQRTLASRKFKLATQDILPGVALHLCAATGLAWAIEQGDTAQINALLDRHLVTLPPFGTAQGQIDTLVLGCTHYPFVRAAIEQRIGPNVHIVDNGQAVARHTHNLLTHLNLLNDNEANGQLTLQASAQIEALQAFAQRAGISQ